MENLNIADSTTSLTASVPIQDAPLEGDSVLQSPMHEIPKTHISSSSHPDHNHEERENKRTTPWNGTWSNHNTHHFPRTYHKDNDADGYFRQIQHGYNGRGPFSRNYPNEKAMEQRWRTGDMSLNQIELRSEKFEYEAKQEIEGSLVHEQAPILRVLSSCLRKKLLIIDVNGLLADVIFPPPKEDKADINIYRRAIFKRPFVSEFLKFCFERFDVAIWSSRTKKILDSVVDYLLGDMRCKLLFCWDQSHCTKTGFRTLENNHKELLLKEIKKVWEKHEADLPYEKGYYDESNTLLLDDSPYKALLNPRHTAVFPHTYSYKDTSDNSLGTEGDLRVYLTGLVTAENVKKYVEEHPFGQQPIDEANSSWEYYLNVITSQTLVQPQA